jgi:hypothetical protein
MHTKSLLLHFSCYFGFLSVLWELLTRQEPFAEFDDFESLKKAVCEQNMRLPIPSNAPAGYYKQFICESEKKRKRD